MRPDDIRNFLNRRPFQPFRITLTDGRNYEVRHPELVMVGRSSIVIGLPAPGESDRCLIGSLRYRLFILCKSNRSNCKNLTPGDAGARRACRRCP